MAARDPVSILRRWAEGAYYPLKSQRVITALGARMAGASDAWWAAFREVLGDADEAATRNLAMPLRALLENADRALQGAIATAARTDRKVAEVFWAAMAWPTPRRSIAYNLLGRNLVVQTYVRYCRTDAWEDSWSFDALMELLDSDPEELWEVARELLRLDDDQLPAIVGAVILEELLKLDGQAWIGRMEVEAARSPDFRVSLSTIAPYGIERGVIARAEAATGRRIQ